MDSASHFLFCTLFFLSFHFMFLRPSFPFCSSILNASRSSATPRHAYVLAEDSQLVVPIWRVLPALVRQDMDVDLLEELTLMKIGFGDRSRTL